MSDGTVHRYTDVKPEGCTCKALGCFGCGGKTVARRGDASETDQAYAEWRAKEFPAAAPSNTKPTNPKDAIGSEKVPLSLVPDQVIGEISLALLEGACKYGAANWRQAGVRASVYVDAARRHLASFREGRDIDPASGLSEITKAIAGLVVLRDSMLQGNWVDDRLLRASDPDWVEKQNEQAKAMLLKFPAPVAPCTQIPNVLGSPPTPLDAPLKACISCGGFSPRGCQDC